MPLVRQFGPVIPPSLEDVFRTSDIDPVGSLVIDNVDP
jgi:hypothetical protein